MNRLTFGKSYFYAVTLVGVAIALWVGLDTSQYALLTSPLFMGLALIAVATELVAVPLPRGGRVTASFAFLFASLLTLGLLPTIAIIALLSMVANLAVQRRHWSLATFNLAQYTISYGAAYGALTIGGFDRTAATVTLHDLPVLLGATLVQLAVNIALVNGYIALEKRISLWQVLWEDDRWEFLFTLLLSPLSVMMVALYRSTGWQGAAMVLVPILVSAVLLVLWLKVRQSRQELAVAHHELSMLHQIAQRIGSQIDLGATLTMIATELKQAIPHDECMIFLLDDSSKKLLSQRTQEGAPRKSMDIKLGEGLIGRVAQASVPVRLDHMPLLDAVDEEHLAAFQSALCVPIVAEDKNLGVIALFNREARSFDLDAERMLTVIATHAAIAIKNAQLYQTTQQLAITDGLTGVYNRRYFQRMIEAEFRRAPRFGYPVGLILIDVDHFKQFNDTHGHLLGDQVLRSIGQILKDSVRETDVVARYGGEEFAVILPETNSTYSLEVAERIRKNVARHTFWGRGQTPVTVTVSIGVASRMAAEIKSDELIELADAALYEAKGTGRDRICTADEHGTGFTMAAPRHDPEAPKKRAPARKLNLNAEAWRACLEESLVPLMALLEDRLADKDLPLDETETTRWRSTISAIIAALAHQLEAPSEIGRLTSDQLASHPLYPEIKAGVTHLIQRGITLTQSESLVLALCTGLGQHVQNAPFSPQERLHVLSEVERFTHTLQLATSQVWHDFYQQTNTHLMVLHDLEQRITNVYELDELLGEAVRLAQEALRADACLLFMPDASGENLRVRAFAGLDRSEAYQWMMPMGAGITGEVFETLRPAVLDDYDAADPRLYMPIMKQFRAWTGVRSGAYFPLAHQGEPVGVIIAFSRNVAHFEPAGIRLGRGIAGQLAAAIARMQAQDSRQETFLQAITALVESLEAKDDFARGHSETLVRYATAIGREVGLPASDLEVLRHAGTLHDLGKIGIPEALLLKPDRLTPEERHMVQTHPEIGAQLIATLSSFKEVAPIVRHHHEHWNGSGYPDGLAGDAIPLLARILAIAEAFDGMTTPKLYRGAIPIREAVVEMRSSGNFDPQLLDVFERLLPTLQPGTADA
ncbi:MAG TPA: diguanylate cyclase [Stenomitos sp.]